MCNVLRNYNIDFIGHISVQLMDNTKLNSNGGRSNAIAPEENMTTAIIIKTLYKV